MYLKLLTLFLSVNAIDSARILAVLPLPAISHQVVFRALIDELATRGHSIVVITPNPRKDGNPNIEEIDTSDTYSILRHSVQSGPLIRGIKLHPNTITADKQMTIVRLENATLENSEVKKLLKDPEQKFDLIIAHPYFKIPIYLKKVYNAPVIVFSSFYGTADNYNTMGAPNAHPLIYGNFNRNRFFNLTLWEKIYELYIEFKLMYGLFVMEKSEEQLLRSYFGDNSLSLDDLKDVDLLFANVNPIFEGNRPVPPNVIHLGALHLKPVKPLPLEWSSYLDARPKGVIYVSLGTNVHPSRMDAELLQVFLDAFGKLPYDVLWKFDGELKNKPDNLRTSKWFPQRDLLFHPNIKAFVIQGGLQSTDEAIDAGVPLIGIPMIGDQSHNCERYEKFGIGVHLKVETLTADEMADSILKVIEDESYRKNIVHLRNLMRDQPQSPMERAVWWVEYLLRHKGAKHLKPTAANIPWTEYLMLDVVAVLLTVLMVTLGITVVLVNSVLRLINRSLKMKGD